jgi:hypothetical protein
MKNISFFLVGIFAGILMTKSEVLSWFRIFEMFRFESFHMYGVIGVAVVTGIIFIFLLKRWKIKTWSGDLVSYNPIPLSYKRHIIAGSIFGLGWAMAGSCPGPMYALFGNGYWIYLVVLISATLGTFAYGVVKDKLPH